MNQFKNTVVYHSRLGNINSVMKMWKALQKPSIPHQCVRSDLPSKGDTGKLPPFISANFEYLYNVTNDDRKINFDSKFSPNEEVLLDIADYYDLEYMHTWYNGEYHFYGVSFYLDKKLFEFEMEKNDYLLYAICEDGGFIFQNKYYTNRLDIFSIIISRKIVCSGLDIPFNLLTMKPPEEFF